ncbi:hypothetical protein QTP88_021619 [Uroleucon formosanum]
MQRFFRDATKPQYCPAEKQYKFTIPDTIVRRTKRSSIILYRMLDIMVCGIDERFNQDTINLIKLMKLKICIDIHLLSNQDVLVAEINLLQKHETITKQIEVNLGTKMLYIRLQWLKDFDKQNIFEEFTKILKNFAVYQSQAVHNPDLCFVSKDEEGNSLELHRNVLTDFPHSQHRPVVIEIGIDIHYINSIPKPRWNFQKANWPAFTKTLDDSVRWIPPTNENYHCFSKLIISTAKKFIPGGIRKTYIIPGFNEECQQLYTRYTETNSNDDATKLIQALNNQRKEKWLNLVKHTDFKHSSRKAWALLRKLGGNSKYSANKENQVNPNLVANRIVNLSRATPDKLATKDIKSKLRNLKIVSNERTVQAVPFSIEEISEAILMIKPGKAAGLDNIYPEFRKHTGPRARALPTQQIVIVQLALLSVCYKLLERLVLNRIGLTIDTITPIEQAGFRPGKSYTDQIAALTTYIEKGFQNKKKTTAAFIDLTAAYDTVWREGLLFKLLKTTKCLTFHNLLNEMLTNRYFKVLLGASQSSTKQLNNGLPQGSVLAPTLFNLYISDLPSTISRKFAYADDITVATQHEKFENNEAILNQDLEKLRKYFQQWRLKSNIQKTEISTFHLNNKLAKHQPTITFGNQILAYNPTPKYLGVTLDRTLTYKIHLQNTAAKIRTRNNIIQKLAGSTWGASTETLRTSALALVYSAAEYAAPVWLNSAHCSKIDVQLNSTMRVITGVVKTTPTQWLPVLCNIHPPHIRRLTATTREWSKYKCNEKLPINKDIPANRSSRLKSRKPVCLTAKDLIENKFKGDNDWRSKWSLSNPDSHQPINDPCSQVPGFSLKRRE